MTGVPNVFGNATTAIPLTQLDQNFNTTLQLGNTSIGLGNVSNTFTPNSVAGIVGTTTNDSVNAGGVGEYVSSTVLGGSAIHPSSGANADITSIDLTAGDWDVGGVVAAVSDTTMTNVQGWTNTTSATKPSIPLGGFLDIQINITNLTVSSPIGTTRVSIAGNTTVYLSTAVTGTGTLSAYGTIWARRRR